MADSDNTTALPFVIQRGRRKSCAVDDDGVVGGFVHAARLRAPLDPCVVLFQEWEQAHHMAVVLCRLQQRLEIRIRNALASPKPDEGPETDDQRMQQASVLAARQARWDELDVEVGYSRARAAEAQAVEAEEEILDAVATTPAQSFAGVIAKLKIIVGGGENMGDMSAFPWPQIQSVLADLKALGGGLDTEANDLHPSVSDSKTTIKSHPR
ncbi:MULTISPECIES: hypothetical protein [Aminobacter]|uniref:hypothetical protein n=1 Tax=Aminobacter TaxID=31988 RepID=UPI0012B0AAD8|nr:MULTISPECIES: hypothetical protein [Aminobacter]MCX8571807.1 hypothetical protein [Aminobacter sp. MET-1]MDR7225278.1 hypothetical protein [Aminobacter aminovorans]MRX33985.1 hypothetical protein [Aminobacter sp. MDW-2]QNH33985.1 hypothetical protein H5P29_26580 [Aminobacter sp. MDW-2]